MHNAGSRTRPTGLDVLWGVLLLAFVMVGTAGAAEGQADALRDIDAGGFVLAALSAIPFVFRRAAPATVALVSATAVSIYFALGYTFGPVIIALGICIAAMAASVPLARSVPVGVVLFAILTTGMVVRFSREPDDSGFVGLLVGPAWLAIPFAIGVVVRARVEGRHRTRREQAEAAVHSERMRIAAEVHDVAGHGLAVIAMQAGVALHVLERRPEQARVALEEIRAASTEALDGLRATLASLRSPGTEAPLAPGLPGLDDLPALVERIRRAGLVVELEQRGEAAELRVDEVGAAAYRIVQEALTNVLRHAGATRAWVTLEWTADGLRVLVRDDGTAAAGPAGGGIAGMRERTERLGGVFAARAGASGGFEVSATLPNRVEDGSPRVELRR